MSGIAPPAGAGPGQWMLESCAGAGSYGGIGGTNLTPIWVPAGGTPPPPPPPPNPATVAAQAESEMSPPAPVIERNPAAWGVVNLPEWLWVDPSMWQPITTTATACNAGGCVTASATATPVSVAWLTGDGGSITCNGPGTVYNLGASTAGQSTDCSHTYTQSSLGQPSTDGDPNNAAFTLNATVSWDVTWSAWGAASGSGSLGTLYTSATAPLRVEQIEAINSQ